jgi:3-isopropylmalate/(R)-2-methylmalate dehydratase small subunit
MQPFTILRSRAAPVNVPKIDTGMIFPGRFGRRRRRPGTTDYEICFLHDLRFNADETPNADFSLNQPAFKGSEILVTAPDFGCGSSRETAAYATMDYGVKALIGASFGDIYRSNCMQNGILPVVLPEAQVEEIMTLLKNSPGTEIVVDLPRQVVELPDGRSFPFEVDALRKKRLLEGVDDVDVTLQLEDKIESFKKRYFETVPWRATDKGAAELRHDD